jgi:hypothetical protein
MRNQPPVTLSCAAVITIAAAVAAASPALGEDPIVKLVSVENAKCLQPVNGSGDADECGSSVVACRSTQSVDLSGSTNLALRR